jgi:mRNA interferase MazF
MKDYEKWHPLKKKINNEPRELLHFHEREIWHCHLGENVGFEQDGRGEKFLRPIVIIKKFNNNLLWGIPLTKTIKPKNSNATKYYYEFAFAEEFKSQAILSQMRPLGQERLVRHIGTMSEEQFLALIKKFKVLLP